MRSIAQILPYIQIGLSVIMIALVLLQRSDADLGGTFGGSDNPSAMHTRRGLEKNIFIATIIAGFLLVVSSLVALVAR